MSLESQQTDAAAPAAADDDETEFEAHFNEAAGVPAAEAEAGPDEPDQPAPAGTETTEADASPAEATPATDGAPSSTTDDIWAAAPEALRTAYEAERKAREDAEHRIKSDGGRVASLNTQVRTLRQQLEQAQTGRSEDGKPAKLADILGSDEFKSFRENFGADMGPLISALEAAAAETGSLSATTGTLAEQNAAAQEAANMARIEAAIPGWQDKMAANQAAFKPWLDAQPQHVQDAFFRNEQRLTDPAQAIDVVQRFLATVTPAPAPTPDPQRDARRSGQLDAATSVQTKGPAATAAPSDDFDAEFALAAARREKARA